ncbi:MAG: DUF4097 family beta strand repeat-containing protein [Gemmatimonadota bacterium]
MKRTSVGLALSALLVTAAVPAAGQVEIRERHPVAADGTITVKAISHDIQVRVWDENEVEVTGSYDPEWEELVVEPRNGGFFLEIMGRQRRGSWSRRGSPRLEVSLPRGAQLDLGTVSGDLTILEGVRGRLDARSVSGDVEAHLQGTRANVQSVSGDLTVRGRAIEARLSSVSGDVDAAVDAEVVEAKAVSGDVRVQSSLASRSVTLDAVSGNVEFTGALTEGGRLRANSHSGRVTLTLPSDTQATFELSTFSGRIQADFPQRRGEYRSSGRGPGERLSFTTGSGNAQVEARSFSGGIRINGGGG